MTAPPALAIIDKLRKVLALTTSPIEGEATAAAEMLQKLLTAHNLSVADLEKRGHKAPGVKEDPHDLGKAAFTWKLDLAEAIADHYYCVPLVDRKLKTVHFVGRPENVESLKMLYAWLIQQIKDISSNERRNHFVRTNEHIDPLRWQVNFGIGVVQRLRVRMDEIAQARTSDVTSLVISHAAEASDYLEATYGYRVDGRMTKAQEESEKRWAAYMKERQEQEAEKERLKTTDPAKFYELYPHEHPDAVAKREKDWQRSCKQAEAREKRNAERRTGRTSYRPVSDAQARKDDEAYEARSAGKRRADDVNLQPFLKGDDPKQGKVG